MAEVRKKEVKDEYGTSKIKVKESSKKEKVEKKVKKDDKKKSSKDKGEKKGIIAKFLTFCNGVKDEFNKVHWTPKSDMIKYSIVCILFIIFSALFFFGVNKLFEFIQKLF